MTTRVKDKYDLIRDNKGFLISSINDFTIGFVAKVLACKMLCKMWPNLCIAGTVALAQLCEEGVSINWLQFLLNEFLADTTKL